MDNNKKSFFRRVDEKYFVHLLLVVRRTHRNEYKDTDKQRVRCPAFDEVIRPTDPSNIKMV